MFYDLFTGYTELKAETLGSSCFINDGKGNFKISDLPDELQLSPLFAFQHIRNTNAYVAGGNFFGVIPYEGRYDAASLTYFETDRANKTGCKIQQSTLLDNKGEVRDMKWLQTKNGDILVVARNNEALSFYMYKDQN